MMKFVTQLYFNSLRAFTQMIRLGKGCRADRSNQYTTNHNNCVTPKNVRPEDTFHRQKTNQTEDCLVGFVVWTFRAAHSYDEKALCRFFFWFTT